MSADPDLRARREAVVLESVRLVRALVGRISIPDSPLVSELGSAVSLIRPALEEDPRLETAMSDIGGSNL